MKEHFKQALAYVREHKTWSEERETTAWDLMERCRCPISQADSMIADEVADLMEEYGDEHDLPEGWWYDFGDVDDIFEELYWE